MRKALLVRHHRQRQVDPHGGTHSRMALHIHRAMELPYALLEAAEAEAAAWRPRVEADAVVDDRDLEPIGVSGNPELDVCRSRMPGAVRERLLDDTIDAGTVLVRQSLEIALDREVDAQPRPACEVADVPFQGCLQAEIIQHARPQSQSE